MPDYPIGPGSYFERHADIAEDVPDYPAEWTSEQRLRCYWFALGHNIKVQSTHAWHAVLVDAERTAERHRRKVTTITEKETLP